MLSRLGWFSTHTALLVVVFAVQGWSPAHVRAADEDVAPHPSAVLTEADGSRHLVIGMDGRKPIVRMDDGSTRTLSPKADYFVERAPGYHPGLVRVVDMELTGMVIAFGVSEEYAAMNADRLGSPSWAEFRATLISDLPLKNCMVAIVTIDPLFLRGFSDDPHDNLVINEISDLRPGKPLHVKFKTVPLSGRYFVLIFSEGREVRSDKTDPAAAFFRRVELLKHRARVAEYRKRYEGQDRTVAPSIVIPPLLADGTPLDLKGRSIAAQFTVETDGTVSAVSADDQLDPFSHAALLRALRGWLFLPQLQAGHPVAVNFTSPLQF